MIFIKEIGSIRKLDELGRVVIPKSIRDMLNMDRGDNIEFFIEDNKVMLKKGNAFDVNYELIYNLLQLLYLKYHLSSVILEKNRVCVEYGKNIDLIKEFIAKNDIFNIKSRILVKVGYLDKYYYIVLIRDFYYLLIYEDKMIRGLEFEVINFIIDYLNKIIK